MAFPHEALGRLFGAAVVDTLGTVVFGLWLAQRLNTSPSLVLSAVFLAGEIAHILFL